MGSDNLVAEMGEVNVSPDGDVIALMGVPGGPRLRDRWDVGVWIVGADDGQLIHSTPPGWMCFLPDWGPHGSYVQLRASPEREWRMYYAGSAGEEPRLVASQSPGHRLLSGYPAPWLDMAVIQVEQTTADGYETFAVYMVPVAGGDPQQVATAPSTGRLVAVLEGADEGVEALLLFAYASGLRAVAYPSGDHRLWQTALGPKVGIVSVVSRYDEDEIIVVERPVAETAEGASWPEHFWIFEEGGPRARLWVVDLATGSRRLLVESAFSCNYFVDVLVLEPSGERQVFYGGSHSIYRVTGEAGRAQVSEVVRGSNSARPGGARVSPDGGVTCYIGTTHCLWRCRLRDGTVELLFGTPGEGDDPPEIVAGVAEHELGGET